MLALKSHDVLSQALLILGGHFNEPSMPPAGTNVMGFDEVYPENLDGCVEEHLAGGMHRERENVM